ncbi:MAG: TIGR03085 family metal-binding protein [Acidimicrobiales bacterium]
MARYAQAERAALADLLLGRGPDAPTLCEGWRTRDLAAHLVLRETRPDAAAGILIRPLAAHTDHVQRDVAARPWPQLVQRVRSGPPSWLRPLDEPMNVLEYFVHHEDVRRAADGWEPRALEAGEEATLWRRLRAMAKLSFRRAGLAVELDAPGHGVVRAGRGTGTVRLVGAPPELLLVAFGRGSHARVQREGSAEALARLDGARLGL